jgi:hypothetical protein
VQSLPEAVATCVEAAQAELDEPRQVALMKVYTSPSSQYQKMNITR